MINSMLPVDTGFEFESYGRVAIPSESVYILCRNINAVDISCHLDGDDGGHENKVRIRAGVDGAITLWKFLNLLKERTRFNDKGCIHYHVGIRDFYTYIPSQVRYGNSNTTEWAKFQRLIEPILQELDTWGYQEEISGSQRRRISECKWSYVRIHPGHYTAEFRIGEPSYDYQTVMKRVIHIHQLVKKMRMIVLENYK